LGQFNPTLGGLSWSALFNESPRRMLCSSYRVTDLHGLSKLRAQKINKRAMKREREREKKKLLWMKRGVLPQNWRLLASQQSFDISLGLECWKRGTCRFQLEL
jgi:hypothetical protein